MIWTRYKYLLTCLGDFKNTQDFFFLWCFFEGRPRHGKTLLPYGLTWLPYLAGKVEKIFKGSLDSISSPSLSMKIQIMGGKICLWCKGKTLLGVVNKLFVFQSLLTTHSNVVPLYLKQIFPPIIWIFTEGEVDWIQATSWNLLYFNSMANCYIWNALGQNLENSESCLSLSWKRPEICQRIVMSDLKIKFDQASGSFLSPAPML